MWELRLHLCKGQVLELLSDGVEIKAQAGDNVRSEEEIRNAIENYSALKQILERSDTSVTNETIEIIQGALEWVLEE